MADGESTTTQGDVLLNSITEKQASSSETESSLLVDVSRAITGAVYASGIADVYDFLTNDANFVSKVFDKFFGKDTEKVFDYLKQDIDSTDETHTAIIIPSGATYRYANNNLAGSTNILKNELSGINKGIVAKFMTNAEELEKNDNQQDLPFSLWLSMPVYETARYSRQYSYTKEPYVGGNNVTEFMCRGNRKMIFTGWISDITQAQQYSFRSSFYETSKLRQMTEGFLAANYNNYASRVIQKAKQIVNRNKTLNKIYQVGQQIDNLAEQYGVNIRSASETLNDFMKGKKFAGKMKSKQIKETKGMSLVQMYILVFDNLASIGSRFDVYYAGLKYSDMAITSININQRSVNVSEKNVSLNVTIELEQQVLAKMRQPRSNLKTYKHKTTGTKSASETTIKTNLVPRT